jgi:broad specificity phosphatase PhoE
MHLYLIRHGELGGNAGVDHSDDPGLTERGREQAQLTAAALRGEGIDSLHASSLSRSLETARPMAEAFGVRIAVWPDLAEIWGTGHDVMTRSEVAQLWPEVIVPDDMPEEWWPQRLPENEDDGYRRAARVASELRAQFGETDRRVALVSHGTFGAILMSWLLGAPPCGYTRFSQANCCMSRLEISPERAKMIYHNRTCHLPADMIT